MNIDSARLNRCLDPASIAVVGGTEAAHVVRQSLKLGFEGDIWPVNPRREQMHGIACFADIDDLPGIPDAVFIAIPADPSIELIAKLSRLGAGGAVCYASGFREVGDQGSERHRKLVEAAGTMPVIGPNCYGFLNLTSGAALWPDYHGAKRSDRGVAIFSQSGNVSLNLSMQQRELPLAWLVTLGNQAVVGIEECIDAALDNDAITAIGIHVEGLAKLPRFAELACRAREKGIPIVALKVGRSETGARITLSHTATLAGESALYDALFERLGVGLVSTPEEFLESLKLLSITGVLGGNRIASMSCSGGEATLVADLSSSRKIEFPSLDAAHRERVQVTLNEYVRVDNPLDYHTFIWGDPARMSATFTAMMSGGFDLTLLVIDTPNDDELSMETWLVAIRAFVEACENSGGKGALVSLLPESIPVDVSRLVSDKGVVPLHGLASALAAIEVAAVIGDAWARDITPPRFTPIESVATIEFNTLDEYRAKSLLAEHGMEVPLSAVAHDSDQAAALATDLGFPVVVKSLGGIAHKAELGGVRVNLKNEAEVREAANTMIAITGTLMVEKMVEETVAELLLGISHDPQFGHYLILAMGGTLVELFRDRRLLLLPTDADEVRQALMQLKSAPLLLGYRGRPSADVEAAVECVMRLCRFIEQRCNDVLEVEVNPLLVKEKGQGAAVADALIRARI